MLKIIDSTGKKVGVLKDDDDAPVMEVNPNGMAAIADLVPEEEEEEETDEGEKE